MKTLSLLLLWLSFTQARLWAQQEALERIRAEYYETSRLIEQSMESYQREGVGLGLYLSELRVNSLRGPWRAVGDYEERIRFWHSDDPRVDPDYQENKKLSCLKRIEVSRQVAAEKSEIAFQYLEGELVFALVKAEPEVRVYLQQGEIFRVQIADQVYDENHRLFGEEYLRVLGIVGESGRLVKQFLAIFLTD